MQLEPHAGNVTNSNAAVTITPSGRLYAVYSMNLDHTAAPACRQDCADRCCQSCHHTPQRELGNGCRTDLLGHFVMRYSDDMGASWSSRRYEVPYPLTWIDRQNVFNGSVRMMWTVSLPTTGIRVLVYLAGDGCTTRMRCRWISSSFATVWRGSALRRSAAFHKRHPRSCSFSRRTT